MKMLANFIDNCRHLQDSGSSIVGSVLSDTLNHIVATDVSFPLSISNVNSSGCLTQIRDLSKITHSPAF